MSLFPNLITVGARGSPLSKKQVEEVLQELQKFHPEISFTTILVPTAGDIDLKTSLRILGKTDFFTKEIEEMQMDQICRISVHSAKDLPETLREGLQIVAITKGVCSKDVLLFREKESIETIDQHPKVGSSSPRRDEMVLSLLPSAEIVDIRGNILARIDLLEQKKIDALVIAKAALIRLEITKFPFLELEGETHPLQGKLAVVARREDTQMKELFSSIDSR